MSNAFAEPGEIAIVLKGYPRLSETFIAQEIRALEQRGLRLRLYAMRQPTDPWVHPVHHEIAAPVVYLPEYLHWQPLRVWRAWRRVRRLPGYLPARQAFLRDVKRDKSRNRVRRFGQALVLADELPRSITWLHAHFLHTPASVTRYAAALRGLPWSVAAHAKDVWITPEWEKREKLAECQWAVTCTRCNAELLRRLAPVREHVGLIYHGLDSSRFPMEAVARPARDGRSPEDPIILLSVGRAVEKKGFDVLLHALARLPPMVSWRLAHIGAGTALGSLQRLARELGIASRIRWHGAQPQPKVIEQYRQADLFVLACRVARDGDRDGLPNVLMEAQSFGLACLSTRVAAIPELIIDGETGVLVPPDDPAALADALRRLISRPEWRQRLAAAGLRRVQSAFSFDAGIDQLVARFTQAGRVEDVCASRSMRR